MTNEDLAKELILLYALKDQFDFLCKVIKLDTHNESCYFNAVTLSRAIDRLENKTIIKFIDQPTN